MKKISVIVPCYNSGQWVGRCVGSLLSQTMYREEIEIVLVDDCSTDDTWERLCELEQAHSEDAIIVIEAGEHVGPGGARNLALSYASAPYVAMVDSDDWVEADSLEKMYDAAVSHECDIVCCNAYRDFGDGRRIPIAYHAESRLIEISDVQARKDMLLGGYLKGRMLVRTQYLLENQIFYPAGIVYEDVCWNALNYCYMERIYVIAECLYHYFVNPTSVVMKPEQDYSHDMFTTNYIKWNELTERGFYELMPREIEFDILVSYYLMILKMYKLRFDTIPAEGFREMQEFILNNLSDYRTNPYINTLLSEGQRELLNFIDKPMGERELQLLHDILVKMADL